MVKLYPGVIDLHNHSLFSDGDHSIDELIQNAIKMEINVIGITDHYEKISNFDEYVNVLNKAIAKYKNTLKIRKGIEIKSSNFIRLSAEDILKINQLDYVLIEDCEYCISINEFMNKAEQILSDINVSVGIAHLDLMKMNQRFGLIGINTFMDFLEIKSIFFEINSNLSNEFYDLLLFNRNKEIDNIFDIVKNHNISISVGSDTHSLIGEDYTRLLIANKFADEISNFR